jgi:hypothetical protein
MVLNVPMAASMIAAPEPLTAPSITRFFFSFFLDLMSLLESLIS